MIGKSIYDHIDGKDFESQTYRFRFTEEFELEREERKLAIKLLRRRDDILKAVHLFSERFLRMPLTESSIEPILELLAEGLSSKAIAAKLFISPKTVENHRANIMNKLDLHSTLELVRYAAKLGLIDMDLWTN